MAVSITLFVLFCAVSYSIAAYHVPRCSGSAIEVTATKTVLQTNIIPMTTTAIQVLTATSLLTRTAHFPSTVSQAEFITLFQEPVFLPQTRFVTETNVRAKSLVYTSTEFRASFVTESHLAADVLPVYVTTQGYVTSTLQSVVVIPSELTSQISLTKPTDRKDCQNFCAVSAAVCYQDSNQVLLHHKDRLPKEDRQEYSRRHQNCSVDFYCISMRSTPYE